jgi:hypothetical protein
MEINWSAYLQSFISARSKVAPVGRVGQRELSAMIDYLVNSPNEPPGHAAFAWAVTAGGNPAKRHRVSLARSFLEFVGAFEEEVNLPPNGFLPSNRRPEPFIFTREEVLLINDNYFSLAATIRIPWLERA